MIIGESPQAQDSSPIETPEDEQIRQIIKTFLSDRPDLLEAARAPQWFTEKYPAILQQLLALLNDQLKALADGTINKPAVISDLSSRLASLPSITDRPSSEDTVMPGVSIKKLGDVNVTAAVEKLLKALGPKDLDFTDDPEYRKFMKP